MARLSSEEHAKRVAEKVGAAQTVLAAEVESLVTGADWRDYLDLAARLHAYSPNNIMLVRAQHAQAYAEGLVPASEPTFIAGFGTWKALGRCVERGQHGYMVFAPVRYKQRTVVGTDGKARLLKPDESATVEETETTHRALRGFRIEHVFDASQTTGEPLPIPPRPELVDGEAPPGLGVAVMGLIASRGFTVDTVADATSINGANGQTNWGAKTVLIRADMDDAAMVKTLLHEAAHVLLHERPPGFFLPRPLKEVEAESVAYVVAQVHGMATDGYSFPYVAGWAGANAAKAVTATQARVGQAATALIAVSPAAHDLGGKPPGATQALAAARQTDIDSGQRPEDLAARRTDMTPEVA
ncbi:MAG: ImmA/IrrE family metallo-endopeptidase [Actinomycetota bacterium]|nr:ImmA/IrrE family metallo-endopeptidase [Actinomycetota bacterium]